jgi:hypothetical protein
MVLELKSWVRGPGRTGGEFFAACIPPSLASAWPIGTVAPEREQVAPIVATRTEEGKCWTIA